MMGNNTMVSRGPKRFVAESFIQKLQEKRLDKHSNIMNEAWATDGERAEWEKRNEECQNIIKHIQVKRYSYQQN